MIIWLASYPRSGNTLLRTILYQTMGLKSASDEEWVSDVAGQTETALSITGITEIEENWEDYYQSASSSSEVFLIKTHRPPRDDQPAIYVVRDGRNAFLSYSHFHQQFTRPSYPSLLDLVLGCDFYGDWSDHYRTWIERDNTFLIRYEDLVDISDVLLKKLAHHVKYSGELTPWINPFDLLHHQNPDLFRVGDAAWKGDTAWTTLIESVFFYLHGNLMLELGYTSAEELTEKKESISEDMVELVQIARRILIEKKNLESICVERQMVIAELKQACDERLGLIQKLFKRRP